MVDGPDDAVSYRELLTDPALLTVFLISGTSAVGNHAVPVALPVIGDAFALSESEIGLVMSAFALAVLVALPVVSVLADVYGRRPVVIPSLLLFGLAGTATLGASSYGVLLALRALQGAAFAGTLPLTATLVGDLYTGPEGSSAQGIRSGLNGLAGAVAPVVAGVLAAVAWQYPFALYALSFPVAGLVYWYYPEPVAARGQTEGSDVGSELRNYWRAIWGVADRRLAVFLTGGLVLFFLKGGFATFLPVFVVDELGAPVTAAGTILGVYGGTRVVVSPLSGSVLGRLGRKRTMVLGAATAAVGIGALPGTSTLLALGAASGVFAVGEALLNPVLNDAVAATAASEQRAGVMAGLQILKNVSLTVAPALLGFVIGTAGFAVAFLLTAALGAGFAGLVVVAYRADSESLTR
jgi:MFS family permease